jgi:hypothetical protein
MPYASSMRRRVQSVAVLLVTVLLVVSSGCSGGAPPPSEPLPATSATPSLAASSADAGSHGRLAKALDAGSPVRPPEALDGGPVPPPPVASQPRPEGAKPAPRPETGTPPRAADRVHLYRWEPLVAEADDIRRLALTAERFAPPHKGQRMVVVDQKSPPVEGRVVDVIRMARDCELCGLSSHYFIVELPAPAKAIAMPWAVGPIGALPQPTRLSLVEPEATSLRPAADVRAAVDLDGDGDADVAIVSASGECAGLPPIARGRLRSGHCSFVGPYCVQRLARKADGWKAVERMTNMVCSHGHREGF